MIFTALAAALAIFISGCSLIEKTPEGVAKERIAKVGSEYITRGEFNEMMGPVKAQLALQNGGDSYLTSDTGKQAVSEQEKYLIQSMVVQTIMNQKAAEMKLFSSDKEIDNAVQEKLDALKKQYTTEDEFNKKLKESDMTLDLLKKYLRNQVIGDKVYDYMVKDVTVTDDEIKKYYEENKYNLGDKPSTMEVSHILVGTEAEAKTVKQDLDKGADFAAVSTKYSIDTAAKQNGGSLGEVKFNDPGYDAGFVKAAMALKVGQISDPVKTQYGYHIIKVTKRTENPAADYDKVKDSIKETLLTDKQETKYQTTITTWETAAKVKILDKSLQS